MELTAAVVECSDDLGLELLSPREPELRGGLIRVRVPGGPQGAERVLHALFERDVVVDRRGDALRISPHFFNSKNDIERCFSELRVALQGG